MRTIATWYIPIYGLQCVCMHTRVVEHYHKKQSYYIEEECKENELRVTSSGKPQDLA